MIETNFLRMRKKDVRIALEQAYEKLRFAAFEMDVIDNGDAEKIAKVRKATLALITYELKSL